jgi:hypothetical protein
MSYVAVNGQIPVYSCGTAKEYKTWKQSWSDQLPDLVFVKT